LVQRTQGATDDGQGGGEVTRLDRLEGALLTALERQTALDLEVAVLFAHPVAEHDGTRLVGTAQFLRQLLARSMLQLHLLLALTFLLALLLADHVLLLVALLALALVDANVPVLGWKWKQKVFTLIHFNRLYRENYNSMKVLNFSVVKP